MSRKKSLLIIVGMIFILASVSFFGTTASFERSVYATAIETLIAERHTKTTNPFPIFASRPHECEASTNYIGRPIDRIEDAVKEANSPSTRPISLTRVSHLVPVMKWEDNLEAFRAAFGGLGEAHLVYVSRVGFDRWYTRAGICLTSSHAPHGWGTIVILERSGLSWSVVSIEGSRT